MKAHLEVREIPCPYCDETFPQRHVLHQHLVNAHEQSINLTCPVCQKVRSYPINVGMYYQQEASMILVVINI